MKISSSDKFIAYLTLLSGLTISTVAIYYSVAGLVSIFAAAAIPIIVMGAALEISKLIATVWLKLNWQRAPIFIRSYLLAAIAILMLITSMGIFGFLSKAHSDQSLVSGDVQSKISIFDEKIKTSKDNIEANRKALKQMDEAVDQSMARSTTEQGADKAVAIRRSQAKERARLQNEIAAEQKTIAKLNEEAAPIRAEVRKVEAEVGPIKYIAKLIYGDNPDANILEKAVTWVIIIIVIVFDPLAVILLLASQYSFQWFRQSREEDAEGDSPQEIPVVVDTEPLTVTEPEIDVDEVNALLSEIPKDEPTLESVGVDLIEEEPTRDILRQDWAFPKRASLQEYVVDETDDDEEEEIPAHVKSARAAWKLDNPNDTIKHQRRLFDDGIISALPWDLPPYSLLASADVDYSIDRPGDYLTENEKTVWLEKDGNVQVRKEISGYQQNEEQGQNTLWQQIQAKKQ